MVMRITRNLPGVITNCEGPTTIIRHKKPLRSYGDKRSEGWGKESRRFLKEVEGNLDVGRVRGLPKTDWIKTTKILWRQ